MKKYLPTKKTKAGNLDVEKLQTVSSDLSKVCNVVYNNAVIKMCVIKWLKKSILLKLRYQILVDQSLKTILKNKVFGRRFKMLTKRYPTLVGWSRRLRFTYNTKITQFENKITSNTDSVTTAALNAKATQIENKKLDITNLVILLTILLPKMLQTPQFLILVGWSKSLIITPKLVKLKKKQPDVSDSDKNLRNINTKVTSNKIRQVPTEAKLSEHIFPIRIRTNR